MVRTTGLIALFVSMVLWASPARSGDPERAAVELTYEQALVRARAEAPRVSVARARVAEAEGRLEAAGVRPFNPQVLATAGPRLGGASPQIDASVRATQWFEAGGQRGRRVDVAGAQVEASDARSEDAERLLLRDVGLTFVTALYWRRRIEIASEKLDLATKADAVARRRHEVGDVGGLEASSAALAVSHARAELERTEAALAQVEGQLAALLGVEAGTPVHALGDLRELAVADAGSGEVDLDARPDLRALAADVRGAQALGDLGRAKRAPNLALGLGYAHEESEHVVFGVVGISLPVFDRGQGERAVADAGGSRARLELDAARSTAAVEAETAEGLAERTRDAAIAFERDGLDQLERTAALTTLSYEKGAIAYDELLIVRLEVVAARLDYAELLRAAATARVELAAATGAL